MNAFDLVLLGLGAIIGTGIFVITGTAANVYAGPGLILSFVLAAAVVGMLGLCYAEFAARFPVGGGPYTYLSAVFNKPIAWMAAWFTMCEFLLACASVASGWSGYVNGFLSSIGYPLPVVFQASFNPEKGTYVDLIAVIITFVVAWIVTQEVKKALRLNNVMFMLKLIIILLFLGFGIFHITPTNWTPFLPYGTEGIGAGASIVFFAFLGFDAIALASEDVENPQKNVPIGMFGAIGVSAVLYIIVTIVLTGMVPYTELGIKDPISYALRYVGLGGLASVISVGAIITLLTVLITMSYSLTRLISAVSRDGLLPKFLSEVNPKTNVPVKATWFVGIVTAIFAGLLPLNNLAQLTNIVTLVVMGTLALGIIVLRKREGKPKEGFSVPFVPVLPIIAIIITIYLILQLDVLTWKVFAGATILGVAIYYFYGRKLK